MWEESINPSKTIWFMKEKGAQFLNLYSVGILSIGSTKVKDFSSKTESGLEEKWRVKVHK